MYKLTVCGICGTDIMQEGCCGNETVIFKCPCGETYLKDLENKNKIKIKKQKNIDSCKYNGEKK